MIVYDGKLVLFGGQGLAVDQSQPGAEFRGDPVFTGFGWTNELHTFDLNEG